MKRMVSTKAIFLFAIFGCSEAPLINQTPQPVLNNPTSLAVVPGTNTAIVLNANLGLAQTDGSLLGIDLATRTLKTDIFADAPSLGSRIVIDSVQNYAYVTDRGKAEVLGYAIQNSSGLVSLSNVSLHLQTDKNPYDLVSSVGLPNGDFLLTSNEESGTVSFADPTGQTVLDLYPENAQLTGLPLVSASDFKNIKQKPAKGITHMAYDSVHQFVYVANVARSNIYVINLKEKSIEAVLDLSTLTSTAGVRGMALSSAGILYASMQGTGGVVALDVRGILANGISYEVLAPTPIWILPIGQEAEDLVLSTDEKRLFISDSKKNVVDMLDLSKQSIAQETVVGRSPSQIVLNSALGEVYVVNTLGNSISVLSETSGQLLGTIE